jgi:hypothetical protein
MIKLERNTIYRTDSKDRTFRYEVESVSRKIKNMMKTKFNESNWGRITQHIDNGCMMISACRGERTEEENKKKTDELAKDIRSYGLGYIRILGGYIENKGTEDEKEVTEESFFVPKNKDMDDEEFFDIAIKLCKKYNQDSVLISLPDFTEFGYYDKSGNFDFSPGEKFIANDKEIGEYFSALVKGGRSKKKFAFQDVEPVVEWLAVRHPNSAVQATWMSKMKEYF